MYRIFLVILAGSALVTAMAFDSGRRMVGPPVVAPLKALPLYYGPTGQPACGDIDGNKNLFNCWFDATLCALAKGNPGWITFKVKPDGDIDKLSRATFTVFAPGTHDPYQEIVNCADAIGKKNDNSDDNTAWWVGGFQQAARQASAHLITSGTDTQGFKDGEFDPAGGSPYFALQILTGIQSNNNVSTDADWSADTLWSVAVHADTSPILIGTKHDAKKLWPDNAYTIMTTSTPGGQKTLTLFDTSHDRSAKDWAVHDIFEEVIGVYYLEGFAAWTG